MELDRVAGLIAERNAVDPDIGSITAGLGALESGARQPLIRLAEALGAPLATTAGAKDLVAGHPADLASACSTRLALR